MSNYPYLSFCPRLQQVVNEGAMLGVSGVKTQINAITSPENMRVLYNLVRSICPKRTIEIGFARGGSAAAICSALRDSGALKDKQHTALDPYAYTVWDGTGSMLLQQADLSDYCIISLIPSYIALPEMFTKGQRVQLLYIDGSHYFEYVFTDFFLGDKVLEVGGYVVFDDLRRPEVAKTVRFIMKNCTEFYERINVNAFEDSSYFTAKKKVKNLLGIADLAVFRKKAEFTRGLGVKFRNF